MLYLAKQMVQCSENNMGSKAELFASRVPSSLLPENSFLATVKEKAVSATSSFSQLRTFH